jgi:translation initiation factor IF-3
MLRVCARGVLLESKELAVARRASCTQNRAACRFIFADSVAHGIQVRVFVFSSLWRLGIQDTTKRVRVNRQIRISPVRVIGADGSQLGILEVDVALRMAEEQGLDLVEVAATARPPVVRIMDYGKYKFEMAKQARQAKKKQHVIELKEVKYRPGIDDHDFDTKTRHARRFLEEKNKVKVTMMFRGRQVAHPELGQAVLDRVAQALTDVGKIESSGRLEGKSITMILAPK